MQSSLAIIPSTIIKKVTLPETSHAIDCNVSGEIIAMDETYCSAIDYQKELQTKVSCHISDKGVSKGKIYTHPKNNKMAPRYKHEA